ncbi:MAG TPA: methyltransferase [Phenylobacterium sp.]|jgi:predicted methyltransferase|uniref:class I SAM-dependent methyltransferase n=1 Tax=Phenylobacterium sp. TaxID=1871053 RepID=UPI002B8B70AA|nr:methyltransferase [Phenylobacterium sp.]HXA39560.1 methyltransferase [Phenylobacterium sp.]
MKSKLLLAAAVAVGISAAAAYAAPAAYITAAVADKGRPEADTKRDADRKPAEMLEFAGVKPGQTVVDLLPGGGYFTRVFAKAVGPKGVVYAVSGPPRPSQDPTKPAPTPAIDVLAADPAYANVKSIHAPLQGGLSVPTPADVIWTSQNYHDVKNVAGIDMLAFDKAIYASLKPGGVFIVLDHVANPGDPNSTKTLHRIDPAVVKQEVTAAGFKYEGESTVLKNPADDHTKGIRDGFSQGQTDQFIYKFRKPK